MNAAHAHSVRAEFPVRILAKWVSSDQSEFSSQNCKTVTERPGSIDCGNFEERNFIFRNKQFSGKCPDECTHIKGVLYSTPLLQGPLRALGYVRLVIDEIVQSSYNACMWRVTVHPSLPGKTQQHLFHSSLCIEEYIYMYVYTYIHKHMHVSKESTCVCIFRIFRNIISPLIFNVAKMHPI